MIDREMSMVPVEFYVLLLDLSTIENSGAGDNKSRCEFPVIAILITFRPYVYVYSLLAPTTYEEFALCPQYEIRNGLRVTTDLQHFQNLH